MSKMTSDLYYTQLSEIDNFSTTDKRIDNALSKIPEISSLSDSRLSFYTEIVKDNNTDKWSVILHVIDKANNNEQTSTKIYDSFYKILMEPKSTLQSSIKSLIESNHNSSIAEGTKTTAGKGESLNTETLSGTWTGENYIDKVVILRGGRGFVIFNNGASMNISVEINSRKQVVVTQKGRSNASFFPNLPRNLALNAALSADPIIWKFSIVDSNTLSGFKTTLVSTADTYDYQDIQVTWNRIN
ncbi:MAG: hypothetical protein SO112_06380 [Treponema sp.]|nr:hypothetical protein [Treponema sp.]